MSDFKEYVCCSDENHLIFGTDEKGLSTIKNIRIYYIENKNEVDFEQFKNFLEILRSSKEIDWEEYKNLEIQWAISNKISKTKWEEVYLTPIGPGTWRTTLHRPTQTIHYEFFPFPPEKAFQHGDESENVNKENFYRLIQMIDLQPEETNFEKIEILKKSLLQNEKYNFCTSRRNRETPRQNILLKYGFIILLILIFFGIMIYLRNIGNMKNKEKKKRRKKMKSEINK